MKKKQQPPTIPYTIRISTQLLTALRCDKKALRKKIAQLVNIYLKKQK